MKQLTLTVYEPGELIGTMSTEGKVAMWRVAPDGQLVSADNRLLATGMALDTPIEELDPQLTVRTYNCLKREGIHTVGALIEFVDRGPEAMMDIRNFGQNSVAEVTEQVQRIRGLPVSTDSPEPGVDLS